MEYKKLNTYDLAYALYEGVVNYCVHSNWVVHNNLYLITVYYLYTCILLLHWH
ncbi:unnamed protein product [Diabrotica balteata]|uniref:Uncharacterized protein n=1 Tax=Diabrotica balteata TaxID=107213 RepID=A0A9N9SW16_DIABA|nr:unnamed protein product [Diabrotica balteata]